MNLQHWKLETDAENLAWLWFDRAGAGTNTFSSEALRELGITIHETTAAVPLKVTVLLPGVELKPVP